MTDKERELFTQALKLITELDKEGLVLEMGLILEMRAALAQPEQEPFKPDWVSYRQGVADGAAQTEHNHLNDAMSVLADVNADLIKEAKLAQPEHPLDKKADNARELGLDYEPEQEPVAWLYNGHLHECDPSEWAVTDVTPLYKLPPHKPWVGLTDGEINTIANSPQPIDETSSGYVLPFAHAIEARLKEINR